MTLDHPDRTAPRLDRRVVVRAAAWTVPAVAVATAAPLASASEEPVYEYDFAGISATGSPGQRLTAADGPGARIRVAETGAPVPGQLVQVSYISGPFRLLNEQAHTDGTGAARVGVCFDDDAVAPTLGAILASWIGLDGNSYEAIVDVSVS
jgi:hypothetical protein